MKKRCPSAEIISKSILEDYELCFPITSPLRQSCGVASIKASEGKTVEGVVYSINDDDLEKLDGFEGLGTLYNRKKVSVQTPCKRSSHEPWTYYALSKNPEQHYPPSDDYISTILRGAQYHQLSDEYLSHLKQWQD